MVVLQQGRDLLGLDGLGAEPKELLGVDEVPARLFVSDCVAQTTASKMMLRRYVLGEVAALVLELAVLDGLGLLLGLLLGLFLGLLLHRGGGGGLSSGRGLSSLSSGFGGC